MQIAYSCLRNVENLEHFLFLQSFIMVYAFVLPVHFLEKNPKLYKECTSQTIFSYILGEKRSMYCIEVFQKVSVIYSLK